MPANVPDNASLAERFARRETGAFEEFVALYQSRVARLVGRLLGWQGDAEDIVQDVFLAALAKAHTFRGRSTLWTWLTVIAVNRCRSHHRRSALLRVVKWKLGAVRKESPAADRASHEAEVSRRVREAVAALPVRDREAIVLFYLEQRSAGESSAMIGISVNAFEVRLHRARQKLKRELAELSEMES